MLSDPPISQKCFLYLLLRSKVGDGEGSSHFLRRFALRLVMLTLESARSQDFVETLDWVSLPPASARHHSRNLCSWLQGTHASIRSNARLPRQKMSLPFAMSMSRHLWRCFGANQQLIPRYSPCLCVQPQGFLDSHPRGGRTGVVS